MNFTPLKCNRVRCTKGKLLCAGILKHASSIPNFSEPEKNRADSRQAFTEVEVRAPLSLKIWKKKSSSSLGLRSSSKGSKALRLLMAEQVGRRAKPSLAVTGPSHRTHRQMVGGHWLWKWGRECVKLKHCRLRREVCICVSPTQNLTTGTFITICLGAGCGEWLAQGSKQSPWVMLEGSSGTSLDVHALAHIFQRPGSTMTTRDRQITAEKRYTTGRHFQTHMHAHTAWYRRGEG